MVPKFLSVRSIVIAPAKTGKDRSIRKAVTTIDQGKRGVLCNVIPGARIFKNVVIIFIALSIDEAPDKCIAKIARSIDIPCSDVDKGAYNTHPTPDPN